MSRDLEFILIASLLWGPTTLWLAYRLLRGHRGRIPGSSDAVADASAHFEIEALVDPDGAWVCGTCRSLNRQEADRCYSCRARKDSPAPQAPGALPISGWIPVMADGIARAGGAARSAGAATAPRLASSGSPSGAARVAGDERAAGTGRAASVARTAVAAIPASAARASAAPRVLSVASATSAATTARADGRARGGRAASAAHTATIVIPPSTAGQSRTARPARAPAAGSIGAVTADRPARTTRAARAARRSERTMETMVPVVEPTAAEPWTDDPRDVIPDVVLAPSTARVLGVPVCPFLGWQNDSATRSAFPDPRNVCHAVLKGGVAPAAFPGRLVIGKLGRRRSQVIGLEHQRTFCLSATHAQCSRYAAAEAVESPDLA